MDEKRLRELEKEFYVEFVKKNGRVPEYVDAIELAIKKTIDKGGEFLKQQGKDWWEGYGIPFSIEDYRKAMMEEQK